MHPTRIVLDIVSFSTLKSLPVPLNLLKELEYPLRFSVTRWKRQNEITSMSLPSVVLSRLKIDSVEIIYKYT